MDDRLVGKSDNNVVSATSSKRTRTPNSVIQAPSCLVDGCDSDLSKCRDYHRRHKVCELHSKTPKVTIKGQDQRFCQQCSRFHSLIEFDEGKRSCRKRLDGHNRRRRKPQPEQLPSSARFLENYKGARFLAFDNPQASVTSSSSWTGQKAKNIHVLNNSPSQINFNDRTIIIPECHEEQKQFSFLQGTGSTYPAYSSSQLDHGTNLLLGCTSRSQKTFSNTLNGAIQSDCALSLLSSTPALLSSTSAVTHEFVFARGLQPSAIIPPARSIIPSLSDMGMEGESANPVFLGGSSSNSDVHCHGMFHVGPDGSSSSSSHKKSFSWE